MFECLAQMKRTAQHFQEAKLQDRRLSQLLEVHDAFCRTKILSLQWVKRPHAGEGGSAGGHRSSNGGSS